MKQTKIGIEKATVALIRIIRIEDCEFGYKKDDIVPGIRRNQVIKFIEQYREEGRDRIVKALKKAIEMVENDARKVMNGMLKIETEEEMLEKIYGKKQS